MHARSLSVSPDYLRAIGVPLLAGRWLTTADHFDAPKVVLVNKALALQYWPTVEACVGQQIYTRNPMDRDAAMTIVGVIGDVKDSPTDAQAPPAIYAPFLQNPSFGNYVVLRAATDPAGTRRRGPRSGPASGKRFQHSGSSHPWKTWWPLRWRPNASPCKWSACSPPWRWRSR